MTRLGFVIYLTLGTVPRGLRGKAADLGKAIKESALTLGERFKDEEVKAKFRDAGKAAQAFGKSVTDMLNDDKTDDPKKT